MLNHSRRAPPPAPLIRLYNPNGEERKTQVDQSSANSSPIVFSSERDASEFDSVGSFDEHSVDEDYKSESSGSSKPYIQLRMEWLKSSTLNKHDSLPTSVSSISSRSDCFMIPSPTSATSNSIQEQQRKGLVTLTSSQSCQGTQQDKTKPVIDWLGQLADSSFNTDGEVLLFFQSDKEPGKRVRFEC